MKYTTRSKRIPIMAGMPLDERGDNKIREVGYKIILFIYDSPEKDRLTGEKEIKRVFY